MPVSPEHDLIRYLPEVSLKSRALYWVLLAGLTLAVALLPLIRVDIGVRSVGAVRPVQERTELKLLVPARIEQIYYREGDLVPEGALIMRVVHTDIRAERHLLAEEQSLLLQQIRDLERLTGGALPDTTGLETSWYRKEAAAFLRRMDERLMSLNQAEAGLEADLRFAEERLVAPHALQLRLTERDRLRAALDVDRHGQMALWQQQLAGCRKEWRRYRLQQQQLLTGGDLHELRAPVTGTLMDTRHRYPGSMIPAGEVIGTLSPSGALVADCLVPARDIGMICPGQPVRYRITAFDFRDFGGLSGSVMSVGDDMLIRGDEPHFLVRGSFDSLALGLRNGFRGRLKKGMVVQARFLVARRSLWQLLFDRMDDWLNPAWGVDGQPVVQKNQEV